MKKKKKFLTIGEGIERGIAAIDAGEIKWGRGYLKNSSTAAYCILGAAAEMEKRAGGIRDEFDYALAISRYTDPSFFGKLTGANDGSRTWDTAKARVRLVLADHPKYAHRSPAREAYEARKAKVG